MVFFNRVKYTSMLRFLKYSVYLSLILFQICFRRKQRVYTKGPNCHLFPSNVAGHLIGKGGETIAELRRSSGTNIQMSKATDLFPGTQVSSRLWSLGLWSLGLKSLVSGTMVSGLWSLVSGTMVSGLWSIVSSL